MTKYMWTTLLIPFILGYIAGQLWRNNHPYLAIIPIVIDILWLIYWQFKDNN